MANVAVFEMNIFKKKIFAFSTDAFGLDLSDLSIKVVQLGNNGIADHIQGFGSVPLPLGAVQDGEIKNKQQVVQAITKVLGTATPKKITSKKVICSLPETKAFLRIITIPQMEKSEAHEAIKWEMEATIPMPLDQVYYDWQILDERFSKEKNKMSVLVCAVSKSTIDTVLETLIEAGLEPIGLEIESIAQLRSLVDEKDDKKTVLLVDIGDRRTSFVIANGGIPSFTSSLPISGNALTDAIAKAMNIPFDEAEKTKFQYGIGSDFKNDAIYKAVRPVLENMVTEVQRSIEFYLSGLQYSANIDTVVLCGGGANTKGIVPYFSKRLEREIELANPWTNVRIGKSIPVIEKAVAAQYATAIGLALKGLHYEDIS